MLKHIERWQSQRKQKANCQLPESVLASREAGIPIFGTGVPYSKHESQIYEIAGDLRDVEHCGQKREKVITVIRTLLTDDKLKPDNIKYIYRLLGWYGERTRNTVGIDGYTLVYCEDEVKNHAVELLIADAVKRPEGDIKIAALRQLEKQLKNLDLWERDWYAHDITIAGIQRITSSFETPVGQDDPVSQYAARILHTYLNDKRVIRDQQEDAETPTGWFTSDADRERYRLYRIANSFAARAEKAMQKLHDKKPMLTHKEKTAGPKPITE